MKEQLPKITYSRKNKGYIACYKGFSAFAKTKEQAWKELCFVFSAVFDIIEDERKQK